MANVEFVLALERRMELVPLRRGWWVTQPVEGRVRGGRPWERMTGPPPKGAMLGGGGLA